VKVGLGTSSVPPRARIKARAKVVFAGAKIALQCDDIANFG